MNDGMPASRFYMWRAVVAMAHADGIVTPHEINFLQAQMRDLSLSVGQLQTLAGDLGMPQNVQAMFRQITRPEDRRDFFTFARVLSWSDGNYDVQEQHILDLLAQGMQDNDNRQMLAESRDAVREITLDADQWDRDVKEKGLLGMLRRLAA